VGSPLFANEAAQRVTWLARNGIEHAEIRVTPPDMGPIQVSIDMHDNEATINFVVTQTDTRVALEDSLHQLEEMLAESGIALSQASVGQQDAGQSFAGGQSAGTGGHAGARPGRPGGGDADLAAGAEIRRPPQMRGLVDTFA
jgi:flagellar hook-length control protein FliK